MRGESSLNIVDGAILECEKLGIKKYSGRDNKMKRVGKAAVKIAKSIIIVAVIAWILYIGFNEIDEVMSVRLTSEELNFGKATLAVQIMMMCYANLKLGYLDKEVQNKVYYSEEKIEKKPKANFTFSTSLNRASVSKVSDITEYDASNSQRNSSAD